MASPIILLVFFTLAMETSFGMPSRDDDGVYFSHQQSQKPSLGRPWVDPGTYGTGSLYGGYRNGRHQFDTAINYDPSSSPYLTGGQMSTTYNLGSFKRPDSHQIGASVQLNPASQSISGYGLNYRYRAPNGIELTPAVNFDKSGSFRDVGMSVGIPIRYRGRRSLPTTVVDENQINFDDNMNDASVADNGRNEY